MDEGFEAHDVRRSDGCSPGSGRNGPWHGEEGRISGALESHDLAP